MRYDAAGLRAAASGHRGVAATAEQMVIALARTGISPAMFGGVGAAARLAAAVELARQAQGRSAAGEAAARTDLGDRVHDAAAQGDGLTARTTAIASAVPGAIVAGMAG